jgi:hypothetical protein
MATKKGKQNARRIYRQQVLSGFERVVQPANANSGSEANGKRDETPQDITGKKYYQVLIPVIIEEISSSDLEHNIKLHFNADADLLVSAYSLRGKKAIEPSVTVPRATGEKVNKVPMVYGVHTSGMYTLSYPIGHKPHEGIADIYSTILGQIDTACKRALLKPEKQERDANARKRDESTQPPKDLGANKKARRGKALRAKIRIEALPETSTKLDETDR